MFSVTAAHAASEGITVKLAPYIVGKIFGVPITATLITTWLTMVLLLVLAFVVRKRLAKVPGKLQNVIELLFATVYDYMAEVLESRTLARTYFPS